MHKLLKTIICMLAMGIPSVYAQRGVPEASPATRHATSEAQPSGQSALNDVRRNPNRPVTPVELEPRSLHRSFHLRTDERSLFSQVLGEYNILVTLDSSVRSRAVGFDGDDLSFSEAETLLRLVTGVFFVALDSHRVLVVADTPGNRLQFERLVERKIEMSPTSAAETAEMQNIARIIFGLDRGFAQDSRGRITIHAPEEKVKAMTFALQDLYQAQSELQLDVRICEVDRTADTNTGTVLPNSATLFNVRSEINNVIANNASLVEQIIASGLASAGDYSAILAALLASGELSGTVFNNPFVLFGGGLTETGAEWNTTSANMLLNSSDVKSLNQLQVRIANGDEATFRSGQRYPIMTSSYTSELPSEKQVAQK